MSSQPQRQQHAANDASSSRTQTITSISQEGSQQSGTHRATLRLRGAHDPSRRTVQWAEDVVDNEGLGRKRSKVCCIYHRPKAVDESSDESSSDSSSSSDESDSGAGNGRRRVPSGDNAGKEKGKGRRKEHKCDDHDHDHSHDHGRGRKEDDDGDEEKEKRRPSPNAYERIPKPPKPKSQDPQSGKTS